MRYPKEKLRDFTQFFLYHVEKFHIIVGFFLQVSTRQNGYVMVDYIFYSTYFSTQFSKYIEGNLKLLGRLHLNNAEDCQVNILILLGKKML